tara:strand:- start:89 stop:247 length:159 start_codon:yes stop_codon:yes gene_type:complete
MDYLKAPIFIPKNSERIMHATIMALNYLLMAQNQQNQLISEVFYVKTYFQHK